jgi:tRNA (guanine26-N2/guanine27-N2)-dimethyltransferase
MNLSRFPHPHAIVHPLHYQYFFFTCPFQQQRQLARARYPFLNTSQSNIIILHSFKSRVLLQRPLLRVMSSTASSPSFKTITEGSSRMCYPADQEQAVFYNPVQVQNRDLSILMIALYQERLQQRHQEKLEKRNYSDKMPPYEGIRILDALAASGLRSMRYIQEIENVQHVTINDLEEAAVERAHQNVKENNLQDKLASSLQDPGIFIQQADARAVMYSKTAQYHIIDLDPYGSAASFLDAAVQCVENGGLLCVTCTDMAALGGSHPETCFGRYGCMPIQRSGYLQEMAVRILLDAISKSAARYGRVLRPILSVGMDFYVRVFVEIHNSKSAVNTLSLSTGYVFQSTQCPTFYVAPAGQTGGNKNNVYQAGRLPTMDAAIEGTNWKIAGPIWLGPLHDKGVIQKALQKLHKMPHLSTKDRLEGLLTSCSEELDVPLYYNLPTLAQFLAVSSPPMMKIKAAIVNAGYKVSGYHKEPQAIKTDAPNHVVWDIIRAWCETQPPPKKAPSGALKMRAVEPKIKVNFAIPSSLPDPKKSEIRRFPQNPQPNWGPKPRATGVKRKLSAEENKSSPQE